MARRGLLHLLIDSPGIKAEGEGKWNARRHGGTKRRPWRNIHLGVDEQALEIRAIEVTGRQGRGGSMLPELLGQILTSVEIGSVTADGAYDTRKSHDAVARTAARRRSSRRAGTPSHGTLRPQEPSPATRLCELRNISAAPSGENGPAITAEAAPRQR